jgi:adenylate cyclase
MAGSAIESDYRQGSKGQRVHALARFSVLAAIVRTSAMHYKGSHLDVSGIGRELDIDYVVEGGVRRAEDDVAINVQLIHARDQTHHFAREYNGEMRDVFTLQDCIAQAIAAHILNVRN